MIAGNHLISDRYSLSLSYSLLSKTCQPLIFSYIFKSSVVSGLDQYSTFTPLKGVCLLSMTESMTALYNSHLSVGRKNLSVFTNIATLIGSVWAVVWT